MRITFKAFDSKMASREKLFKHAAEFATHIGPERLITLSHSEDRDNIVITIWYWGEEDLKWDGKGKAVGQFAKPPDSTPLPVKPAAAEGLALEKTPVVGPGSGPATPGDLRPRLD